MSTAIYQINTADPTKGTLALLEASDISSYFDNTASVAIKPNLVNTRPASHGSTTHPEVVEGIILYLLSRGIKNISIIESSWLGDDTMDAYKKCGYVELSKKYGVPLFDLKKDVIVKITSSGMSLSVCKKALDTDFLINVPVLKAHCQTKMTCCMKNLKGVIPDSEKRRYHTMGIHKPVAVLNTIVKTGYCVVDGICGDLTFEEGGSPVEGNRLIAGRDPFDVDKYCAKLIGYEPYEIDYLRYAEALGMGGEPEIVELNPEEKVFLSRHARAADKFRSIVCDSQACSSCYASLIHALQRMDRKTLEKYDKLHIGQGYRKQNNKGVGIGNCCSGFTKHVVGCPPSALDIIKALSDI